MHFPLTIFSFFFFFLFTFYFVLQITVVFVGLWILRGDVNAAKNGLSKSIVIPFWETLLTITMHILELILEQ